MPSAQPLGSTRKLNVLRWEDPSGARLVITMNGNELLAFLPSFAGTPGATLVNVSALSDEVVQADVQDTDGKMLTRLAPELEQGPLLGRRPSPRPSRHRSSGSVSTSRRSPTKTSSAPPTPA